MFLVYVGVSKTIIGAPGATTDPTARMSQVYAWSLCMERTWVLLQVYMNIDVILLPDNFWMEVDRYMCVQTLEGMYNTR